MTFKREYGGVFLPNRAEGFSLEENLPWETPKTPGLGGGSSRILEYPETLPALRHWYRENSSDVSGEMAIWTGKAGTPDAPVASSSRRAAITEMDPDFQNKRSYTFVAASSDSYTYPDTAASMNYIHDGTGMYFAIVFRATSHPGAINTIVDSAVGTSGNRGISLSTSSAGTLNTFITNGTGSCIILSSSAGAITVGKVFAFIITHATTRSPNYVVSFKNITDNTAAVSLGTGTYSAAVSVSNAAFAPVIGARASTLNTPFNGKMVEIVDGSTALTAAQVTSLFSYFQSRYG